MAKKKGVFEGKHPVDQDGDRTIFFHLLPLSENCYVITDAWSVPGNFPNHAVKKAQLHGYDRDDVFSFVVGPHVRTHMKGSGRPLRNVAMVALERQANAEVYDMTDAGHIFAYRLIAKYRPSDSQLIEEHGLDPENTSVEQFHELTGDWPHGSVNLRFETAAIPTSPSTLIDDVLAVKKAGWTPAIARSADRKVEDEVAGMNDVAKELIDAFKAGKRDLKRTLFLIEDEYPRAWREPDPNSAPSFLDRVNDVANEKAKKNRP